MVWSAPEKDSEPTERLASRVTFTAVPPLMVAVWLMPSVTVLPAQLAVLVQLPVVPVKVLLAAVTAEKVSVGAGPPLAVDWKCWVEPTPLVMPKPLL